MIETIRNVGWKGELDEEGEWVGEVGGREVDGGMGDGWGRGKGIRGVGEESDEG